MRLVINAIPVLFRGKNMNESMHSGAFVNILLYLLSLE